MTGAITILADPTQLTEPFELDWLEPPSHAGLAPGTSVTAQLATYDFQEGRVEIDISGRLRLSLSECDVAFFNANFDTGDPVLLGDNIAGCMPVHLTFDPPLREVGACVSASGPNGRPYLAQINVRLGDGSWHPATRSARLSRKRGTAPFLGARADGGSAITEVWFDVISPDNQGDLLRVAINQLLWLPVP